MSFGQLGRDSQRDKEIEMNSWGIQKIGTRPKCTAHKHMRYAACMGAYCVQSFICHIHAVHNRCTHFAEMCADLICCVWHKCDVGPIIVVCSIHAK